MENTNIEIVPAILEKSLDEISQKLSLIKGEVRVVQVDIVDGVYAANTTWPYEESREEFEKIILQEEAFPHWEDFDFQFDLMINDPEREVEKWISAGASSLIIHAETPGALEALTQLQNKRSGEFGVELGVALLPTDSSEKLKPFEGLFDFIQVMGIDHPGFQGEKFDEKAPELIASIRSHYPNLPIQVDGSVNASDIRVLVEAGATRLVVGSAIFKAEDPKEELIELRKFANRA